MIRRPALALLLALIPGLASAQFATIGPTAPAADNGDRIATTAWVNSFFSGSLPLASGKIFIGSVGNLAAPQTVTGDCTLATSGVITCTQAAGNFQVIGNLTVGGNGILATNIAAPATPAAGTTRIFVDSTTKTPSGKNDAGTVSNMVVASVTVANQFMTGISAAGVISRAQPAFTDLSGQGTCAQEPALTGDVTTPAGSCATTLASVITAGGPTGSATVAPIITYDAKGRLTAVSSVAITPAIGSITGLGTGIATALGVNVGTAGSVVVNGGALGTPSSGTLTSATGLPISTGLTGAGTGVLTALGVNVGTAGAPVVNGGVLGTPSSGVATNLTGTASGLTAGNVTTNANLTGPVTSVGNATTVTSNSITNAMRSTMAANSIKGNNTGSPANENDLTAGQVGGVLCSPVVNAAIVTATSGTYTTPTCNGVTAKYVDVELVGPGGGGGGSGTTPGSGGAGSVATTFGTLSAGAGGGGSGAGGSAGAVTGGDINLTSAGGGNSTGATNQSGGQGTPAPMYSVFAPLSGVNTFGLVGSGCGAGGSGAGDGATTPSGGGGAGGGYLRKRIFTPSATYSYAVGGGGAGGTAGTSGFVGGAGTAGCMFVTAYFQ